MRQRRRRPRRRRPRCQIDLSLRCIRESETPKRPRARDVTKHLSPRVSTFSDDVDGGITLQLRTSTTDRILDAQSETFHAANGSLFRRTGDENARHPHGTMKRADCSFVLTACSLPAVLAVLASHCFVFFPFHPASISAMWKLHNENALGIQPSGIRRGTINEYIRAANNVFLSKSLCASYPTRARAHALASLKISPRERSNGQTALPFRL